MKRLDHTFRNDGVSFSIRPDVANADGHPELLDMLSGPT